MIMLENHVVIEDSDHVGAQVLWVLYEALEALDEHRACEVVRRYSIEISLSAIYQVTERSVEALCHLSNRLDEMSPRGFWFGVHPGDQRRLGWWPDAEHDA